MGNTKRHDTTTGRPDGGRTEPRRTKPQAPPVVDPGPAQENTVTQTETEPASEPAPEQGAPSPHPLSEQGFAHPPPVFAVGAEVVLLGDRGFRLARDPKVRRPTFPEAVSALSAHVARERRRDLTVCVKNLAMTGNGGLMVEGEEHRFERDAFCRFASLAGFGVGARFLAEACNPFVRSLNVNGQLAMADRRVVRLWTRDGADGMRSIFAALPMEVDPVDGVDVLQRLRDELAETSIDQIVYDGRTVVLTTLGTDYENENPDAGDLFWTGLRLACDETRENLPCVEGAVLRHLSGNRDIVSNGVPATPAPKDATHDRRDILVQSADAVARARQSARSFLFAWRDARRQRIDIVPTIRGWLDAGRLSVSGELDNTKVFDRILSAWQEEPGSTLADAVNAITLAARTAPDWSYAARENLERQAADLVLHP